MVTVRMSSVPVAVASSSAHVRVRLVVGMHKERVGECSHRNDTRSSFAMYVRSYDEGIRAEPGSWERVMGMQGPTVFDGEILDINMTRSLPCEAFPLTYPTCCVALRDILLASNCHLCWQVGIRIR